MISIRSLSLPVLALASLVAGCSAESGTTSGAETTDSARTQIVTQVELASAEERGAGPIHRHGPHGGPDFLVGAALRAPLDLTAEQRATIEGLTHRERPPFDPSRAKELAAAIRAGNVAALPKPPAPDLAATAKTIQTLHDTLTASQRAALVDDIEAHAPKVDPSKEGPKGAKGPPHVMRKVVFPFGDDLGLTDAQKEELKARIEASAPARPDPAKLAEMRGNMEAARLDMKAKLQSFKADSFDATAFVTPPATAKPNVELHLRGNPLADLVSVLTPEQREKLAQKIELGPPAR
ncbi:MAG: Spy/CpxP family protein refolding chaperone [Labilithrix sp.]|nr:Spy/CpxP family protein refolding chaperone [Labilithrix sp.]MCW5813312.1 Spy/CpxP family protein refolding chaperone [Labilithrix sp.]